MKKTVSNFTLLSRAGIFVLFAAVASAQTQNGDFIVAQHGSTVGSAKYKISAASDGYKSNSVVHVSMTNLNYSLSKTEQLTKDNRLSHVELSASVNGTAVNTSVTGAPNPAQIQLNISSNGKSSNTLLDLHKSAVFMPDFDAGAYETLLQLAISNNNRDLWAIIPKKAGSEVPIKLATYADEKGTFDGKPIEVHHLVANISGNDTHIFSGPHNHVLQIELPYQGFALVRKGFVLSPPAKAGPPPTPPPGKPAEGAPDQAPPTQ
jgi:hypothetical protein